MIGVRVFVLIGFLAGLITGTPHAQAEATSINGSWVGLGVSCSALDNYDSEMILIISNNKLEMHEGECVIRSIIQNGSIYKFKLLCEDEGETSQQVMAITLLKNGNLKVKDGLEYKRCN